MYGTAGTLSGTLVVEKLPVASGGGYKSINVFPIRKRWNRTSLRVHKESSTKSSTKSKKRGNK